MKTLKLFFLMLILMISSCSKNEDNLVQLPSGENTAYYYLNGNLVIPQGFGSVPPVIKAISCTGCTLPSDGIAIRLNNVNQVFKIFLKDGISMLGNFPLNIGTTNSDNCGFNNNFSFFTLRGYNGNPDTEYLTAQNSGEVVITTLSADKRKFTGTFRATLVDNTGATMQVTGGVFNINLDTL